MDTATVDTSPAPITRAEIEAALVGRFAVIVEAVTAEVDRLRSLTGTEPSRSWVSDVIADIVWREFNQIDMAKVGAAIADGPLAKSQSDLLAGSNAELDYLWVRKSRIADNERTAGGKVAETAMVRLYNAARYRKPILEEPK